MTTSFKVETEPGDLSPPLVSEEAAHDWAAVSRRGEAYRIHMSEDGEAVGEPQSFDPRPS